MTNKILFFIFSLTQASFIKLNDFDDTSDTTSINNCADFKKRCDPNLEKPCCYLNNVCAADGWDGNDFIYQCLYSIRFCLSNSDCEDSNFVCINNECSCHSLSVKQSNNKCMESKQTTKLGKLCRYHEECNDLKHLECSENDICVCRSHHIVENYTLCKALLGGFCENDEKCAANSVCIDNQCQCKHQYVPSLSGKCVPTPLGSFCHNDHDCNGTLYTKCSDDKKCVCKNNHYVINDTTCAPLLGEFCIVDGPCIATNSTCVNNKCKCKNGFRPLFNDTCVTSSLGKFCMNNYDCQDVLHSKCSEDNKCVCEKKYGPANNVTCGLLLGEFCYEDEECAPFNSICLFSKCHCKPDYIYGSNTRCIPTKLGQPCESDIECKEFLHGICSKNNVCVCRENNIFVNNLTCEPVIGGFCDYNNYCAANHSTCVNNKCKCKSDYALYPDNECRLVWE
ncbi:prion-like-(Q/N-rich) domain-bearing protein 25 isoform X2 [Microplitis demolitor]|uniref:prion-like-(Q/N-rich) domain-bearing protein 25 isoform X2 n=1 Tax=Microplitis demolitor TaxID=69319 RepID=UPI00043FFF99|nr:prion-like-(Q/N-rich) domain-bearing protein 25 isoform X2 [Microplitis demolitor]